jgi:hypothetical protein
MMHSGALTHQDEPSSKLHLHQAMLLGMHLVQAVGVQMEATIAIVNTYWRECLRI